MKIENEFSIQIPDNDTKVLDTVGFLIDYVEIALNGKK
jgi:acyl carrier protein